MNTNEENLLYRDLSFRIIGFAMQVHNELGAWFFGEGL